MMSSIYLVWVRFNFLLHIMLRGWKYGRDWFFPCDTWSLIYEWYWEYVVSPCAYKLYLKFGGAKNVSMENFPYALALKVTYTLTLLKRGSNCLHSCLVVSPFLMYIKQKMNFYVLMVSVFIHIVRGLEISDMIVSVFTKYMSFTVSFLSNFN